MTTGATALEPCGSPKVARMSPKAGNIMSMASAVSDMSTDMSTMSSRPPIRPRTGTRAVPGEDGWDPLIRRL